MGNSLLQLKKQLALGLFIASSVAFAGLNPNTGCVIAGPENAQLTIEEYVDFQCLYCVKGAKTMREVIKNYDGKVNLVLRNMPLPFHPLALVAAKAFTAVCMQSPDLAYAFQKELFDNQEKFGKEDEAFLYATAKKIGADSERMKAAMSSDEVAKSILADRRRAESHKFTGAPSFLIGSVPLTGSYPYEEIKKIIDTQLGL